jgi:hypothetical protein
MGNEIAGLFGSGGRRNSRDDFHSMMTSAHPGPWTESSSPGLYTMSSGPTSAPTHSVSGAPLSASGGTPFHQAATNYASNARAETQRINADNAQVQRQTNAQSARANRARRRGGIFLEAGSSAQSGVNPRLG